MNIAVVTSNRAEYGILFPLLKRIHDDDLLCLQLYVTGAHLSDKYGKTINQIIEDGFEITESIPILDEDDSTVGVSGAIANAIKGFAAVFYVNKPDLLVLLGDRTELLGVAIAAMNENIPIAHIHGGEITEGAVDDCVRHALTKMSYIHFAGTEIYRKRIIQMGENPSRVFNVGTLSVENIYNEPLMSETEIRSDLGIPLVRKYALVTLHPETIQSLPPQEMAEMICECMKESEDTFFVITSSNSDAGGTEINKTFIRYTENNTNVIFSYSLGMKRYLSAVKYSSFVLGNSSSGMIEAPALGVPTINIGTRQRGRIVPETVINVPFEKKLIIDAMVKAEMMDRTPSHIYGDGNTSERMVNTIKQVLREGIDLKKGFYDLQV